MEAGSVIKGGNPEEGSISSGIYIAPTGLMWLNGGQLEENQAADREVIENALRLTDKRGERIFFFRRVGSGCIGLFYARKLPLFIPEIFL